MLSKAKLDRGLRLLPVALLLATVALRVYEPAPVERLRLSVFDQYQALKPREPAELPVRVLDIDEKSLEKFGQWPWPRIRLAEIIDLLSESGAAAVLLDVLISEPDRLSPSQLAEMLPDEPEFAAARKILSRQIDFDETLAMSAGQANTVIGFVLNSDSIARMPSSKAGIVQAGDDPWSFLPAYSGNIPALPSLEESSAGYGALNLVPDRDGIVRRAPLFYNLNSKVVPSVDAEVLRIAQGASTYIIKSSTASGELSLGTRGGIVNARIGALTVPTDEHGRIWIRYGPYEADLTVPAWQLLDGTAPTEDLAGHIVLIGSTAAGLNMPSATSIASSVSSVVIRAQILQTLISGEYLYRPDWSNGAEILSSLILGLMMIWILPYLGAAWCALVATILISAAFGGSWFLFSEQSALVDPFYFAIVILLVYLAQSLRMYLSSEQERKTVRDAFGRYLSPALVEQLADEPDRLTLGGEMREMSILFCDIRGFTAVSERHSPEDLTRLINRFLTPLTKVILDRSGTIDKYMGDCIMAFWNAPINVPEHALKACQSALAMMTALEQLNKELSEEAAKQFALRENATGEGLSLTRGTLHKSTTELLRVGVGINTGTACVGNLGSEQRFDYSALGDSVNLASRLEGQSKTYGVDILLAEETYAGAEQLAAVELDLVQVVGKTEPVRIFALIGDESVKNSEGFARLTRLQSKMLNFYRNCQWDDALAIIRQLRNDDAAISMTRYYDMFDKRVTEFRAEPPDSDWDGVERRLVK